MFIYIFTGVTELVIEYKGVEVVIYLLFFREFNWEWGWVCVLDRFF